MRSKIGRFQKDDNYLLALILFDAHGNYDFGSSMLAMTKNVTSPDDNQKKQMLIYKMLLVHRNELQNKIVSNTFEKWYKQTTSLANITRLNNFVHQQTFVPYMYDYFDFVYQKNLSILTPVFINI